MPYIQSDLQGFICFQCDKINVLKEIINICRTIFVLYIIFDKESSMNKKIFILSIIALLFLVSGMIFFMPADISDLPLIKNAEGEVSGFAVYTEDGDILYADVVKKSIGNKTIGIIENPPLETVMNIYDKTLESIDNDKKIIIIYIDGLGYDIYKEALETGTIPYMASMKMAAKALTVYPTITDVTFASMVTGKTPKYTGIHNRDKKPLQVPTIFDKASMEGKTSKLIEGNMQIIIDEVETILNIDENKNGTIDDEIYNSAMEELQNPPDVLLVHFHSYDDFGHKFGPSSQEALSQLKILDSYIEDMIKDYDGDVIITSDHGMHDEEGGGAHGTFSEMDLFIPIIIL